MSKTAEDHSPAGDVGRTPITAADAYLPLKALAAYCGLSVRTLRTHLTDPVHPLPSYRVGGKVFVRRSEFDRWAAQFRVERTIGLAELVNDVVEALR